MLFGSRNKESGCGFPSVFSKVTCIVENKIDRQSAGTGRQLEDFE